MFSSFFPFSLRLWTSGVFLWKASILYTFPLVLGKCSFLPEYISSCEMLLKGNGKGVSESVLESIFQMLLNYVGSEFGNIPKEVRSAATDIVRKQISQKASQRKCKFCLLNWNGAPELISSKKQPQRRRQEEFIGEEQWLIYLGKHPRCPPRNVTSSDAVYFAERFYSKCILQTLYAINT